MTKQTKTNKLSEDLERLKKNMTDRKIIKNKIKDLNESVRFLKSRKVEGDKNE